MPKSAAELILITGFLSSGKTTFLQEGIADLEQSKIAVVLNEQGQFRIASRFFSRPSAMGYSFLTVINSLLLHPYRYILAETPGLAQPWVLNQLVNEAEQRSSGKLRFRGMICVIDTLRFLKLFSTVVSMYEQAAYADCFVLTKTDLADPEDLVKIKNILRMIRPTAPVFIRDKTPIAFGTIVSGIIGPPLAFETGKPEAPQSLEKKHWNIGKNPKSTTLIPEAPVNREQLETFLTQMAPKTFMIKGFIHLKGNTPPVTVEIFENTVTLNSAPQNSAPCLGLTFVWKYPSMPDSEFIREWTAVTGVKGALIASP